MTILVLIGAVFVVIWEILHWFSAAYAAAKVHRNHLFLLQHQNKSSKSKGKFRQANIVVQWFLKLPHLDTKASIFSQKLGSRDFWRITNSVLNKGKSAIPPLFNSLVVLSSASDKAKLFAKTFLKTLILMTQVSLYPFSLLGLIRNCISFLYLPRWLKRS